MRTAVPLDTSGLTASIDHDQLAAYREQLPAEIRGSLRALWWPAIAIACSTLFLAAVFVQLTLLTRAVRGDDIVVAAGAVGVAVFVLALTGVTLVRGLAARSGRRQFLLARFARDNGLSYTPVAGHLGLPGMIFGERATQVAWDVVRDDTARGLLIGNQTFAVGTGSSERTQRWGFASVRLGTRLPHIVLDATSNNSLRASNLPLSLDPAQRLGLEGDFDRHFTLYAPAGYERDALYLFTPDVMARFVDDAAALDIEIIDDRLLLYSRNDLSTLDPAVWEWILTTLDAVTARIAQWRRWRDDRLGETVVERTGGVTRIVRPPRGVAAGGRRLTEKVHWLWIVLGFAFFGIGIYALLADAFGS